MCTCRSLGSVQNNELLSKTVANLVTAGTVTVRLLFSSSLSLSLSPALLTWRPFQTRKQVTINATSYTSGCISNKDSSRTAYEYTHQIHTQELCTHKVPFVHSFWGIKWSNYVSISFYYFIEIYGLQIDYTLANLTNVKGLIFAWIGSLSGGCS